MLYKMLNNKNIRGDVYGKRVQMERREQIMLQK